jgi:hypothetical protein
MTETPAGWYPDPSGNPGTRFWDGQAWTDERRAAGPPPPGAPAPPPAKKRGGKCKWVAFGIVALIVVGAVAGGSEQDNGSGDGTSKSADSSSGKKNSSKSCGKTATSDCTPHVGPNGSVKVDALTWRLSSASTQSQIGDTTYGLGQKADGVFIVAKLRVHSTHDESVTLTDNVIKLETGGTTYDPDNDGTTG